MKKIMLLLIAAVFVASTAFAFLNDVEILTKEAVKGLSNEKLVEVYINAKIEAEANKIFHGKAGFTPKEYAQFKDLLAFIIKLRQEMSERNLDAPPIDEWLR